MTDEAVLSVDIISGTHFGSLTKDSGNASIASSFLCVVRFNNKEFGRTDYSKDSYEPTWQSQIYIPVEGSFDSKQCDNNRPFFYEYLEIFIFDQAKSATEKIGECRIPLIDIGISKWYKVVKPMGVSGNVDLETTARLRVSLEITGELSSFVYSSDPRQLQLSEVFLPSMDHHRHLYLDLSSEWAPTHLLSSLALPGPRLGEVIEDMHGNVEWKVVTGSNCFGDKYYIQCTGFLIITDLRIIYLPHELQSPMWARDISIKNATENNLTTEELIAIRRMTYQVPISSIQDCKVTNIDVNCSMIIIESKDGFRAEFQVRRPPQGHRRQAIQRSNPSVKLGGNKAPVFKRRESRTSIHQSRTLTTPVPINFASGLETYLVSSSTWCSRAADAIMFMMREDRCWIKWTQYLKLTCDEWQGRNDFAAASNKSTGNSASSEAALWVKKAKMRISEDDEYRRLRVHDGEWMISSLNCSYELCATYPQSIVLPSALTEEDVRLAATERSKGRLCALSWLHPISKVPLCRSAQPNAGMSGTNCEADKRACLAIKNSCPTGLPLRIADARPKLNANANSLQGKGFENVAFFGGPSVASINFLDVENIHVMRSSLNKLREGWYAASANSIAVDSEYAHSSKWLYHVSTLLRGAIGIAESIVLGYPVLVHCSDGWDRTAQLSSLAQILLDPYYRTIDGFFALVSKDWCAFGHKFEHRTNRPTYHKEHSPTFLQFLDAVFQIMTQYPTAFEYTSHFLVVFAQAVMSGYFTSFRGDCEDERNTLMRRVAPLEDMALSEMQYSTVFCYVYMLLRSESYAPLLINSFYQQPPAHCNSNLYLRVRTAIIDLVLWKEGLAGFNKQVFEVSLGPHVQTMSECISVSGNVFARFNGYLDIHKHSLDPTVSDRLDLLASYNPLHTRASQAFYQSKTNSSVVLVQFRQVAMMKPMLTATNDTDDWDKQISEDAANHVALRIQLWYRGLLYSRRALSQLQPSKAADGDNGHVISTPLKGIYFVLYCIVVSEMKIAFNLRSAVNRMKIDQVRSIIDEVVEESLIRCMRFEAAQRCMLNDAASAGAGILTPERRSAMDSGNNYYYNFNSAAGSGQPLSPGGVSSSSSSSTSSSSAYSVSGGFKSMAAMASAALGTVTDITSISSSNSSNGLPSEKSKDRYSTSERPSEISRDSVSSPITPSSSSSASSSSKKGITKKLFGYVGGMLGGGGDKDKSKDSSKELTFDELYN